MTKKPLSVEALKHDAATRRNIPTAEYESVMREEEKSPVQLSYERRIPYDANGPRATRDRDLDPQLVWRGKDEQDWSDLIVAAPPLFIQEKVHPKVIIDDLKREAKKRADEAAPPPADLFADFNGLKDKEAATEFYQHDQHWSNRMISGDSLSVMASLAERESLRGQVQCIYFDPPYGIKFNSNFQWSTTSRDVKDGAKDQITREPEQVRAFRDTWKDGIHSYLTYLRDRLTVARDLLHESGSIFVQIGDENVHRVRALLDEVFGDENFIGLIWFRKKTMPLGATYLERMGDYIVWFGKNKEKTKFRRLYKSIDISGDFHWNWRQVDNITRTKFSKADLAGNPAGDPLRLVSMWPPSFSAKDVYDLPYQGKKWPPAPGQCYPSGTEKLERVAKAGRFEIEGKFLRYVMKLSDDDTTKLNLTWTDTVGARDQRYVVETNEFVVQWCPLLTTDPGDLVLDPTCGSGTSAYVAEQWGRRWITIDTSRVAVALARSRLMGARYPYYLLADTPEGQRKEGEVTRTPPKTTQTRGDIRHGFVYERVPHITLKDIANNKEIDTIWETWQETLDPLRAKLNATLGKAWEEWEIPREAAAGWSTEAKSTHVKWWEARIARQKEIDASISAKAESEFLYDKPYPDNSRVRVAGPFTVESLSPHRTLAVDWNDELVDVLQAANGKRKAAEKGDAVTDFAHMILENLKAAGVQQAHKEDRITFTALTGWPGRFICAEGLFTEGETPAAGGKGDRPPAGQAAPAEASAQPIAASAKMKRAGIFIGPEFGTVSRPDLVAAAREAGDAGFDVLIACAFNYDAHSAEFDKLGRVPVLKARMNPDLHMGADLKATGAGNLFVIFGEPDIKIEDAGDGLIRVKVFGVDVFKPQTGEVISEGTDGIALWMLDTDYNEESFFVRHAYFLGANDPYKALKTTLKAEIDQEAWDSLHSDTSRPFAKPASGRIAVKVINHLGDEVMKVFGVE
ncbi:site-specific DNA-methyltransferase [Aestuariivirga sp.]|uniref:site-specific DNA-methyltransferase n=1 Tax=Aestuariivirga sp. TaxID=2650926 RepID=UPI0025BB7DFE|nr:site-specific DNA-methyltransferase [Aestuariivirga sp.]